VRAGACLPQRSVHDLPHRTRSGRHEPAAAAAAAEAAAAEAEVVVVVVVVGLRWGR